MLKLSCTHKHACKVSARTDIIQVWTELFQILQKVQHKKQNKQTNKETVMM